MEQLRRIAQTVLGTLLALTPAALWAAWTPALAFAVLLVALVCATLLVLVTEPGDGAAAAGPAKLSDEFVVEMHRLYPLVYHNSTYGTAGFRSSMRKLRGLVSRPSSGR